MNASPSAPNGLGVSRVICAVLLGFVALFFGFGAAGFAVISVIALSQTGLPDSWGVLFITAFSTLVTVACIGGIFALLRRHQGNNGG